MIIDAHLHCSGQETTIEILHALDKAGIDKAVLLAPFLTPPYSLNNPASLREATRHLGALIHGHADRLIGFAVVNPCHPTAPEDLQNAVTLGLKGVKLVPSGWYPYEETAHRIYAEAVSLKIPILFHSGIYIDGKSGRYCRPAYYEAVRDHPDLKVALAHLSWPWCDEAIALGVIDRIAGLPGAESPFRFDLSFGPPPAYRQEVLSRALDVLGPDRLQYGSDRFLPCSGETLLEARAELEHWLEILNVAPTDRSQILGGTAAAWLGLEKSLSTHKEQPC